MSVQFSSHRTSATKIEAELPEYLKRMVETQGQPAMGDHTAHTDLDSSMGDNSKRNISFDFTRDYKFCEDAGAVLDKQQPVIMFADVVQRDSWQAAGKTQQRAAEASPSLTVLRSIVDKQLHELKCVPLLPQQGLGSDLPARVQPVDCLQHAGKQIEYQISLVHCKASEGRPDSHSRQQERELDSTPLPRPEELLQRMRVYAGSPGLAYNTTLSEIVEEASDMLQDTKSSDTLRNYQIIHNFVYDPDAQLVEADHSAVRTAKLSPRHNSMAGNALSGSRQNNFSLRSITASTPSIAEQLGWQAKGGAKGKLALDMSPQFGEDSLTVESPQVAGLLGKAVYSSVQGSRQVPVILSSSTPHNLSLKQPGQAPADLGRSTVGDVMKSSDLRTAIKTKMSGSADADRQRLRDLIELHGAHDAGKQSPAHTVTVEDAARARNGPAGNEESTDKAARQSLHKPSKSLKPAAQARQSPSLQQKTGPARVDSAQKHLLSVSQAGRSAEAHEEQARLQVARAHDRPAQPVAVQQPKPARRQQDYSPGMAADQPHKAGLTWVPERLRTKANKSLEHDLQVTDGSWAGAKSGSRSLKKDTASSVYCSTADVVPSGRDQPSGDLLLATAYSSAKPSLSHTKPKIMPTADRLCADSRASQSYQIKQLVQENLDISKSFDMEQEYKLQRASISNHLQRINIMLGQISELVPRAQPVDPEVKLQTRVSPFSRQRCSRDSQDSRADSLFGHSHCSTSEQPVTCHGDYFRGTLDSALERVVPLGFTKKALAQSALVGLVGSSLKKRGKEPLSKQKMGTEKPYSKLGSVISQAQNRDQKKRNIKAHVAAKSTDSISRIKFSTASKKTHNGGIEESSHISIESNLKNGPMFRTQGAFSKNSPINSMKQTTASASKSSGHLKRGLIQNFDFLSNCKTHEEIKSRMIKRERNTLSNKGVRQGMLFGLTLKPSLGSNEKYTNKNAIFRRETG